MGEELHSEIWRESLDCSDCSELAKIPYLDCWQYLTGLASYGHPDPLAVRSGNFNILKELDIDWVPDQSQCVDRGRKWAGDYEKLLSDDFQDAIRGENHHGGAEYFVFLSQILGGISRETTQKLVSLIEEEKPHGLIGLYYRAILQLALSSNEFDPHNTDTSFNASNDIPANSRLRSSYQGNPHIRALSSVIATLSFYRIRESRTVPVYPIELLGRRSEQDILRHCMYLLRFGFGIADDGSKPIQESLTLREVFGLLKRISVKDGSGSRVFNEEQSRVLALANRLKVSRMCHAIRRSQISVTKLQGDLSVPLGTFVQDGKGRVFDFGSGVPPLWAMEASEVYRDTDFYAFDKQMPGKKGDVSHFSPNCHGVNVDLEFGINRLPGHLKDKEIAHVVTNCSFMHKLKGWLRIIRRQILHTLDADGFCAVHAPVFARGDSASRIYSFFPQDNSVARESIVSIEDLLGLPETLGLMVGTKVKIVGLGVLFGSEESDTARRLQLVFKKEPTTSKKG